MISFRVNNVTTKIETEIPSSLRVELDAVLSYKITGYVFSDLYRSGRWDGRNRLLTKANVFPTGLLEQALVVLTAQGFPYSIIDERKQPELGEPMSLHNFTLYPYQVDAVNKAVQGQRGIVEVATGGGKSLIAGGILARLNIPSVFLVHRDTLVQQTKEKLKKLLNVEIGVLGGGVDNRQQITVAMMQTASNEKYKDWLSQMQCMFVDEAHHLSCDTLKDIQKICTNAFYRFGLTGTPWRDDGAEILIEAATAKPLVQISPSLLIENGFLTKPYIYFLKLPKIPELANRSYKTIYRDAVVDNVDRNLTIAYLANYFSTVADKKVLVAVSHIKHGENLLTLLRSRYPKLKTAFVQGADGSDLKFKMLELLSEGHVSVIIATPIYGEGVDIPGLDVLINGKAQDSSVDIFQLVGRALRKFPGKSRAVIVDFWDSTKYLSAHAKHRYEILASEPSYHVEIVDKIEDIKY